MVEKIDDQIINDRQHVLTRTALSKGKRNISINRTAILKVQ